MNLPGFVGFFRPRLPAVGREHAASAAHKAPNKHATRPSDPAVETLKCRPPGWAHVSSSVPGEKSGTPRVGIIMGSRTDWETMRHAADILAELDVPHESRIVSAHRTPDLLFEYAENARSRGIQVIIAGAGGAAHLPGMTAAKTTIPVLGVPCPSHALSGLDSLLSIVQMPRGVPVGTLAIGAAGATNAALLAAQILALHDDALGARLQARRAADRDRVMEDRL
jgi:5-(carboxyamino)imidazole ribonucleotide mutase